jgi:hypothetical protein
MVILAVATSTLCFECPRRQNPPLFSYSTFLSTDFSLKGKDGRFLVSSDQTPGHEIYTERQQVGEEGYRLRSTECSLADLRLVRATDSEI